LQRPASDYLQTRQEGELTEKMRALTVNWMVEAAGRCDLLTETLFLAVDLFDRYTQHATRNTIRHAPNTTRHAIEATQRADVASPQLGSCR
jgi:hypothetical protein